MNDPGPSISRGRGFSGGCEGGFFRHLFAAAQQEKTGDKIGVKYTAWALLGGDTGANAVDFDGQMTGLKPATCCASSVKICSDHGEHSKLVAVHGSHQPFTVSGLLNGPRPDSLASCSHQARARRMADRRFLLSFSGNVMFPKGVAWTDITNHRV